MKTLKANGSNSSDPVQQRRSAYHAEYDRRVEHNPKIFRLLDTLSRSKVPDFAPVDLRLLRRFLSDGQNGAATYAYAYQNRVIPVFQRNMRALGLDQNAPDSLVGPLDGRAAELAAMSDAVDGVKPLLLRAASGRVLLIKGAAVRRYYEDSRLRQVNDLDIVVESNAKLLELAAALSEAGFEMGRVKVGYACDPDSSVRTPVTFSNLTVERMCGNVRTRIDLHAPGFRIASSLIYLHGLWETVQEHRELDQIWYEPSPLASAMLVLLHIAEESFQILQKDINDLLCVCQCCPALFTDERIYNVASGFGVRSLLRYLGRSVSQCIDGSDSSILARPSSRRAAPSQRAEFLMKVLKLQACTGDLLYPFRTVRSLIFTGKPYAVDSEGAAMGPLVYGQVAEFSPLRLTLDEARTLGMADGEPYGPDAIEIDEGLKVIRSRAKNQWILAGAGQAFIRTPRRRQPPTDFVDRMPAASRATPSDE